MPNDAKLGMIVGVGLVIAIAVVFFRKDGQSAQAGPETAPASVAPAPSPRTASAAHSATAAEARNAIRNAPAGLQARRHTVTKGDTLFSLANLYYQDQRKFVEIFKVNQDVISTPDTLTPGTVLVIPNP